MARDYNYFDKLTVSLDIDGYFPTIPQEYIGFPTQCTTLQLESGGPVEYSFNGTTLHGDMTLSLPSQSLIFFDRAVCGIWFRGSGVVRIEAWGTK